MLAERTQFDPGGETDEPVASIVIPVRDQIVLTRACLAALRRQELAGVEVVVVDDGSQPEHAADLAAYASEMRLLVRAQNGGFASACNAGAAVARGPHLVFLNNDTLPLPGWLDALVAYARDHPKAAVVGARLLAPDGTVQHAGIAVDREGHLRHLYAGLSGEHPAAARSRRVRMATGAAMLVRRSAWEALGGFDAGFANGYEDADLCLRAEREGWEVHVCGDAVLLHLESATRGHDGPGETANLARFRQRWGRLQADDTLHYAQDGLIQATYEQGDVRVEVSAELGRPAGVDGNDTEALLTRRSRECFSLTQENIRLRAAAIDPWSVPAVVRQAGERALSVVVPLSDHGALPEIVESLSRQTLPGREFEVLVVNPGETLDRASIDALAAVPQGLTLRALDAPAAGGRAAAWNRGVQVATGDIVVFLADDFVPEPGWLAAHLAAHEQDPRHEMVGVGPALFSQDVRASPFVRWLEDSGELFGVSFTKAVAELPPGFFFGGNSSIKRRFLLEAGPADERFWRHAWDDYELGLRLRARGMVVRYVPGAMARHEHPVTIAERRRVMAYAGEAAAMLDGSHPAPHPWNTGTDPRLGPGIDETVWAWLRQAVRRRDEDRAEYYRRAMRRAFLAAYRRGSPGG